LFVRGDAYNLAAVERPLHSAKLVSRFDPIVTAGLDVAKHSNGATVSQY